MEKKSLIQVVKNFTVCATINAWSTFVLPYCHTQMEKIKNVRLFSEFIDCIHKIPKEPQSLSSYSYKENTTIFGTLFQNSTGWEIFLVKHEFKWQFHWKESLKNNNL